MNNSIFNDFVAHFATASITSINRKAICLATSILDAAWVRAVRVEVTNLGNDTLTTDIDVLGVASALVGNEVRGYIEIFYVYLMQKQNVIP